MIWHFLFHYCYYIQMSLISELNKLYTTLLCSALLFLSLSYSFVPRDLTKPPVEVKRAITNVLECERRIPHAARRQRMEATLAVGLIAFLSQ